MIAVVWAHVDDVLVEGDEEERAVVEDEAAEAAVGQLGGPGGEAERGLGWGLAGFGEEERRAVEEDRGVAVEMVVGRVDDDGREGLIDGILALRKEGMSAEGRAVLLRV